MIMNNSNELLGFIYLIINRAAIDISFKLQMKYDNS